jgi:glycosyltransferase involved in cell wall biosynthesis
VPLSVIMPVYNEEGAIAAAVADVRRHVLDAVAGAELVAIDDGSRDATGRLLDGEAARDARIRVVHQTNRGHGGALLTGFAEARGEILFLIDSDRQIPLDAFRPAWDAMGEGRDAVFGVRRRRRDPAIRLALTAVIRRALRLLFGVTLADANVPFKLLRRSIWEDARACIPAGTLAPSLFLAVFAAARGRDVVEMVVEHRRRDTGQVSIRRLKLLRFSLKAFGQLLAFRRCLRHAR